MKEGAGFLMEVLPCLTMQFTPRAPGDGTFLETTTQATLDKGMVDREEPESAPATPPYAPTQAKSSIDDC